MILINFELCIPKIQKYSSNGNTTVVFNLGLCKIIWMNYRLSGIFMHVVGLGLYDIDNIANHLILQSEYIIKINKLEKEIAQLSEQNKY